jgi:shikimate 5-dehydrogenase
VSQVPLDRWTPPPAAVEPTMYFIGVSTGASSIRTTFPRWAEELGLHARLEGIDLPIHAPAARYREVTTWLRDDPQSRGALVTTHKIDLYEACRDLFDVVDPAARLMGETSSLSKRGDQLVCHAKDPISAGLALEAFVPAGHWQRSGAEVLLMGAGGSATAISWYLTQPGRGADRPSRVVVTDRSAERLDALRRLHEELDTGVPVECVLTPGAGDNDAVLARLDAGALVVNATGLGKDGPGSPLTDEARFPADAVAWDLNYRGDLVFLQQARRASVRVEDGWTYFLHGWTRVVAEVFDLDIPTAGPGFDRLAAIASETRGPRP